MAARPDELNRLRLARTEGVSPKRFHGWEPSWETTYEYDTEGRLSRSVTRQLEPEYDDATRLLVEGLDRYDKELCPGCNLHESVLADPEHNVLTFEEKLCKVCAAQAVYARTLGRKDADAAEQLKGAPPMVPRPSDGRHVTMRRLTAEEVAGAKAEVNRASRRGSRRPPA